MFLLFSSFHFIFCSTQPSSSFLPAAPLCLNFIHFLFSLSFFFFSFHFYLLLHSTPSSTLITDFLSAQLVRPTSFTRQSTPMCTILFKTNFSSKVNLFFKLKKERNQNYWSTLNQTSRRTNIKRLVHFPLPDNRPQCILYFFLFTSKS